MKFSMRNSTGKVHDDGFSEPVEAPQSYGQRNTVPLENIEKSRWERSWPTIACGAGLFSDGYLNG